MCAKVQLRPRALEPRRARDQNGPRALSSVLFTKNGRTRRMSLGSTYDVVSGFAAFRRSEPHPSASLESAVTSRWTRRQAQKVRDAPIALDGSVGEDPVVFLESRPRRSKAATSGSEEEDPVPCHSDMTVPILDRVSSGKFSSLPKSADVLGCNRSLGLDEVQFARRKLHVNGCGMDSHSLACAQTSFGNGELGHDFQRRSKSNREPFTCDLELERTSSGCMREVGDCASRDCCARETEMASERLSRPLKSRRNSWKLVPTHDLESAESNASSEKRYRSLSIPESFPDRLDVKPCPALSARTNGTGSDSEGDSDVFSISASKSGALNDILMTRLHPGKNGSDSEGTRGAEHTYALSRKERESITPFRVVVKDIGGCCAGSNLGLRRHRIPSLRSVPELDREDSSHAWNDRDVADAACCSQVAGCNDGSSGAVPEGDAVLRAASLADVPGSDREEDCFEKTPSHHAGGDNLSTPTSAPALIPDLVASFRDGVDDDCLRSCSSKVVSTATVAAEPLDRRQTEKKLFIERGVCSKAALDQRFSDSSNFHGRERVRLKAELVEDIDVVERGRRCTCNHHHPRVVAHSDKLFSRHEHDLHSFYNNNSSPRTFVCCMQDMRSHKTACECLHCVYEIISRSICLSSGSSPTSYSDDLGSVVVSDAAKRFLGPFEDFRSLQSAYAYPSPSLCESGGKLSFDAAIELLVYPSDTVSPKRMRSSPKNDRKLSASELSDTGIEDGSFLCQWGKCALSFQTGDQLTKHVRREHLSHVSKNDVFICLWRNCKHYGQPSCSYKWLSKHVTRHCDVKPFKCVINGCALAFATQNGLARHVPSHFNEGKLRRACAQRLDLERSDTVSPAEESHTNDVGIKNRQKNVCKSSLVRPKPVHSSVQTLDRHGSATETDEDGSIVSGYRQNRRHKFSAPLKQRRLLVADDSVDSLTYQYIKRRLCACSIGLASSEPGFRGSAVSVCHQVVGKRKSFSGVSDLLVMTRPDGIDPVRWVKDNRGNRKALEESATKIRDLSHHQRVALYEAETRNSRRRYAGRKRKSENDVQGIGV